MKVDEFSGVGTYLLDADGHRRFGRFATGNFIYGFGAVQRGDHWIFRAQQASQQVWSSPDSLTFLSDGRLHYDFREDRIVIKYLDPPRADQEHTVWLGNFDTLQALFTTAPNACRTSPWWRNGFSFLTLFTARECSFGSRRRPR